MTSPLPSSLPTPSLFQNPEVAGLVVGTVALVQQAAAATCDGYITSPTQLVFTVAHIAAGYTFGYFGRRVLTKSELPKEAQARGGMLDDLDKLGLSAIMFGALAAQSLGVLWQQGYFNFLIGH